MSLSLKISLTIVSVFMVFGLVYAQEPAEEFLDARKRIDSVIPSVVKLESPLNEESKRKGYELIAVKPGTCYGQAGYPKRRIVSQKYNGDTLRVQASIVANCCSSFEGEIELLNNATINLRYTEFGNECFCGGCWFYLTFDIITSKKTELSYYLNGRQIYQSDELYRAVTEEKTFYENGKRKSRKEFLDGELYRESTFDDEGSLIEDIRHAEIFSFEAVEPNLSLLPTAKMNKRVNTKAKAYGKYEIVINAPAENVYKALADIKNWPNWQGNVKSVSIDGEVVEGMEFTWKAKGVNIKSTLHTAQPYSAFGWTGRTWWITAIHNWTFTEHNGQTTVSAEESLTGFLAGWGNKTMQSDMQQSLGELKNLIEKQ